MQKNETINLALHSTKKIKDGHTGGFSFHPNESSYKNKLLGQLLEAYESAFSLLDQMQEDVESDMEEDNLCESFAAVSLSKEDKVQIMSQWSHALILKTFGQTVGYQYLSQHVRTLWAPSGKLDLVDLGYD